MALIEFYACSSLLVSCWVLYYSCVVLSVLFVECRMFLVVLFCTRRIRLFIRQVFLNEIRLSIVNFVYAFFLFF